VIDVATRQSKLSFQLKRFLAFLKILVSKKNSALGVGLIGFFLFLAAAAPLITPYNALGVDPTAPLFPLSAPSKAPTWLRVLPGWLGGNPTLSENMLVVNNPMAPTLAKDGGEWNFEKAGDSVSDPYLVADVGIPEGYSPPGFTVGAKEGSLAVKFSRASGTSFQNSSKIRLYVEFDYPYLGPTGRFVGNIALLVRGSSYTNLTSKFANGTLTYVETKHLYAPVVVRVFIGQVDGKEWKLWPNPEIDAVTGAKMGVGQVNSPLGFAKDPVTNQPWGINRPESGVLVPGGWVISRGSAATKGGHIDSESNNLVNPFTEFGAQSIPDRIVFTKPGGYIYGVEITFLDQMDNTRDVETTVFIDDFGLFLFGTSFGLLGTDHQGRDLFSQLIYGTRISLYIGISVAVASVFIGLAVGLAAGYLGRIVDELLMRVSDLLLVLPGLPLLVVLMAVLGPSLENLMILLALLGWMGFARMVRAQVLSIKERPFVEAAKAVGAGRFHIIINHILPSVMSLVYISLATAVPGAVTAEAALSWLGFYDPDRMSWGRMLNGVFEGQAITNWWWIIPPGLFISLLAVSFILLGYALDEVLNPKLRMRK